VNEGTETKVQAPIREQNAAYVRKRLGSCASELGVRVGVLLALLTRGWHHIEELVDIDQVDWTNPECVTLAIRRPLCTVDDNDLTRLVFLAYDEALRVEISAPKMPDAGREQEEDEGGGLIVQFTGRQRTGEFYEACPTIEVAILKHRCQFPESGVLQ
jgi:hypothetical protein